MVVALGAADLAVHPTAPHEAASALLLVVPHPGLVAAPAAQQPTPVQTGRRPVASSTTRAQYP